MPADASPSRFRSGDIRESDENQCHSGENHDRADADPGREAQEALIGLLLFADVHLHTILYRYDTQTMRPPMDRAAAAGALNSENAVAWKALKAQPRAHCSDMGEEAAGAFRVIAQGNDEIAGDETHPGAAENDVVLGHRNDKGNVARTAGEAGIGGEHGVIEFAQESALQPGPDESFRSPMEGGVDADAAAGAQRRRDPHPVVVDAP